MSEEKLQLLSDAREQLKSDFKALAASALDSNNAELPSAGKDRSARIRRPKAPEIWRRKSRRYGTWSSRLR